MIKNDIISPKTAKTMPKINAVCTPAVNDVLAKDGSDGLVTVFKKLLCEVDIIVMASAVPIEPDTCSKVFINAVPSGYRFLGSAFRPWVCTGIMTNVTPIIRPECKKMAIGIVVSVVTFDSSHSMIIIMIKPGVSSHFGPYIS